MNQSIMGIHDVQKKISEGRSLLLAGEEAVIQQLAAQFLILLQKSMGGLPPVNSYLLQTLPILPKASALPSTTKTRSPMCMWRGQSRDSVLF